MIHSVHRNSSVEDKCTRTRSNSQLRLSGSHFPNEIIFRLMIKWQSFSRPIFGTFRHSFPTLFDYLLLIRGARCEISFSSTYEVLRNWMKFGNSISLFWQFFSRYLHSQRNCIIATHFCFIFFGIKLTLKFSLKWVSYLRFNNKAQIWSGLKWYKQFRAGIQLTWDSSTEIWPECIARIIADILVVNRVSNLIMKDLWISCITMCNWAKSLISFLCPFYSKCWICHEKWSKKLITKVTWFSFGRKFSILMM